MTDTNKNTKKQRIQSYDKAVDNDTFKQDMDELKQKAVSSLESPCERGSNSVSGSTPDSESDDDTLQNAHQMGIAPDADLEHPTALNISKDINGAEEFRKTH